MQGYSNEDNPVKQCGCFKTKQHVSFQINWGMPFQPRAIADAKEFEPKPRRIRLGHLPALANQKFSGIHVQARHRGEVNGGMLALTCPNVQATGTA